MTSTSANNCDNTPPSEPLIVESKSTNITFLPVSSHYPKIRALSSFTRWTTIIVAIFIVNIFIYDSTISILTFTILISIIFISTIFSYFSAKACGYSLGGFQVFYKNGIWWKRQTALSFSRIQHIDVSHGPLDRKFDLATIKFFTAGGATADLRIPGLPNDLAEELRASILEYTKIEFDYSQSNKVDEHLNSSSTES